MTSNINGVEVKYLPGTLVYTKAGMDGRVLASFKRRSGQIWCVCEGEVIWFAPQDKIFPHKTAPPLVHSGRGGY